MRLRALLVLALAFLPASAQAWTSAVPHLDDNPFTEIVFHHAGTTNNQRVTINVNPSGPQFANLALGMGFTVLPNNCASPPCADANGYPNQKPTNGINTNPGFPSGYYGTITWSWSGTGQMQDGTGMPAIFTSILPQGAVFECGNVLVCDSAPHTYCFCTQNAGNGLANPTIVFQYGWLIQSIDNDGGLIRINTKTNFAGSCSYGIIQGTDTNGNSGPLVNITGAAANTGANGTWAITNCGASSFDLVASTFTNAQVGAQGTGVFAGGNLSLSIRNGGTFSGFSNLVIAETPNIPTINAGHYWDPLLVTQLKQLMNPNGTCAANKDCGWLRFMDFSAVQSNWETDFSQRIPATAISYKAFTWYPQGYWSSSAAGAITNTGASGNFTDLYTTGDPPVSTWNGSRYIDGAVVQGIPSATNTGNSPAINVGGHGAKPVITYTSISNEWVFLTGLPASAGLTMQFTFQASWLNSGTPVVVNYPTVSGDTSATCTLAGNLNNYFNNGLVPQKTLTDAGITFTDGSCAQGPQINAPTPQAGALTVTYTSGPAIVTIGTAPASSISVSASSSPSGGIRTFQYNYLMDAWIYQTGNDQGNGYSFTAPFEAAIDLANQVGANVWWTYGFNSSGYITSSSQLFANNLSSGLKFGDEAFNEPWNPFAHPYAQMQGIAASFGFSNSGFLANASYTGLKTKQYGDVAKAAWTGAGRAASDFAVFSEWQTGVGVGSVFDVSFLQGTSIGTANTYIANYGALGGGTVSTNYAASPNRPVDITNFIGMAPYWGSEWWGCSISTSQCGENPITGTVAQNTAWLQAVLDYQNGSTATAYTELTNTFNGTTQATGCRASAQVLGAQANCSFNYHNFNVNMENIAAGYDAGRPGGMPKVGIAHYEGAPQWAFTSNYVSGTNSATDAQSIAQMAVRYGNKTVSGAYGSDITGLSWNVGPWIKSSQPAVSSGTYNSGTGLVTLTLASPLTYTAAASFTGTIAAVSGFYNLNVVSGLTGNIYVGQAVNYSGIPAGYYVMAQKSGTPGGIGSYILNNTGVNPTTTSIAITTSDSITTALTGTGSVASLNGTFTTTPTTGGSTISYTAGTGLTLTITGGTVYDSTASSYELAINTIALGQAWKNDDTYKNLIKTFYYQDLATVSGGNREAHAAQFGYDGNTWGLYPGDYHSNNPYKNYDAIKEQNAGN